MNPTLRLPFYCLWIAPHALQIIILILLTRRKLLEKFPIFSAYIAFSLFEFLALFVIGWSSPDAEYFRWYSYCLGINIALFFGIIWDIFTDVFANRAALKNFRDPLFHWTTMVLLVVASSLAIYTHRRDSDPTWYSVHIIERTANIVQSGLILILFCFSSYLQLAWNRPVFGIAIGVGVLSSTGLALAAIRSQLGVSSHVLLDFVDLVTYNGCVLIWLYYILTPSRQSQLVAGLPQNDLSQWNAELEQLLHR